ncbi:alpha/beta fold hydrolase [Novosphingobium barchaimii]|nr:alpha/beta hydrolase [Novosphingobium barchaimii]
MTPFRSILSGLLAGAATLVATAASAAPPIRDIVLVHGAFVDGSGWRPVYDILTRDGFKVSIVQEPLTGLDADVTATKRVIDQQDEPVILVGHSYGGAIITEAGNDPRVAGLVYIAAHAPDAGETESGNGKRYPAIGRDAITKTADGYTYIDPARYAAEFAADLPPAEAAFEARSQGITAASVFTTPIVDPAWKNKPVWYMVAKADHIISPDLERMYAARAKAQQVVEIPGASHSVYRSHPREVAALIEAAARGSAL